MAGNNSINRSFPFTVPDGGTGISSTTAYTPLCGGTTSTGAVQSVVSLGTSGFVLTSNGAGALPTFQAIPGGVSAAVKSDQVTGTATNVYTNPGVQQYHNSACKAWVKYTQTGTPTVNASYNVSSVTSNGTGLFTINFTVAFTTGDYAAAGICGAAAGNAVTMIQDTGTTPTTSAFRVNTNNAGPATNYVNYMCFFGVQ